VNKMHKKFKKAFQDYGYLFWLVGLSTSFSIVEMRDAAILWWEILAPYRVYIIATALFFSLYKRIDRLEIVLRRNKAEIEIERDDVKHEIKLNSKEEMILTLLAHMQEGARIDAESLHEAIIGNMPEEDIGNPSVAGILSILENLENLQGTRLVRGTLTAPRYWSCARDGRAYLRNNSLLE